MGRQMLCEIPDSRIERPKFSSVAIRFRERWPRVIHRLMSE
jgi:hypothetical protein